MCRCDTRRPPPLERAHAGARLANSPDRRKVCLERGANAGGRVLGQLEPCPQHDKLADSSRQGPLRFSPVFGQLLELILGIDGLKVRRKSAESPDLPHVDG